MCLCLRLLLLLVPLLLLPLLLLLLVLVLQLRISNDRYIRTTEAEHELTAQMMFQRADDAGDIYLKNYEGWSVAVVLACR